MRLQRWLRTAALALVTAAPIMQLSSSTPAAATVPFSEYNVHIAATEPDDEGRPVTLDAGIDVPATGCPCPGILINHGYGGSWTSDGYTAHNLAGDGYIVLRYSSRGFGNTPGEVDLVGPKERQDQLDAIHWLNNAANPVVGGKLIVNDIGQYGASYGGMHAWALAGSGDPAVRTVVPTASWSIPYQSLLPYDTLLMTYVAGFYATGFDPVIAATNSVNTGSNPGVNPPSGIPANNYSTELHRGFVEAMTGANIDDLKAILDSRTPRWDNIHIPVFIVQGTNDGLFTQNQATNAYQQLKQRGVPVRLYVGGIGHPPSNPDPASPEAQHIGAEILQWFDHYLKGVNNGIDQQVPIEYSRAIYFGNQWDGTTRSAATFPFGTPQRYYICTASPQGGTLSSASCPDAVPAAASNAYAGEGYEEEPVTGPSISKFLRQFTAGAPSPLGPTPNLKSFPGTLIYDSAPLAIPLDTAGLPGLDLRASSADYIPAGARGGAAAFQLDPKLYDVDPSGTARLITRGAFAEPLDAHSAASESVTPTHDVRFDVFGLSYLVPAGHRLRLTLSTEDVPYLRPTINPFVVALFAGSSLDMPSAAALQATNFNAVTQVLYAGPSTMTATEGATLSASLISPSSGSPVAGQPLNFAFQGAHYSATTDAGGTASAALQVTGPAGSYPVTVTYTPPSGSAYLGSTAQATIAVTREPTKIYYTGATSPRGNRLSAAAHLQDRLSRPLAGMTVQFTLQGQTTSAVTDRLGNATGTIPYNPASPAATITVAYGGNDTYAGSSATAVITRTGATGPAFSTRDASAVGRIGGPAGVLLLVCLVALLLAAHLQRPNIRSQP